jgi:hypothetical protein
LADDTIHLLAFAKDLSVEAVAASGATSACAPERFSAAATLAAKCNSSISKKNAREAVCGIIDCMGTFQVADRQEGLGEPASKTIR